MNVNIINRNFNGISTAVFYRFYKFIPSSYRFGPQTLEITEPVYEGTNYVRNRVKYLTEDGSEDYSRFWGDAVNNESVADLWKAYEAGKVRYHGTNDTVLDGQTITEYNFSRVVEKLKYNDTFPLELLDIQSKNEIGKNLGGIELVRDVFFPTNTVGSSEDKDYGYFGSLSVSPTLDQFIYMLDLEESYWKIELYEGTINENLLGTGKFYDYDFLKIAAEEGEILSPDIVITLGPPEVSAVVLTSEGLVYPNPTSMYFTEEDPIVDETVREETKVTYTEWKELYQEIHDRKILYLLFSPDPNVSRFNLFASLAPRDKNLNRNMKDYSLRNDDFYTKRVDIVEKKTGGLLIDRNSETLLGLKQIKSPIFNRKLRKARKSMKGTEEGIPAYSYYVRYSEGQKVMYDGKVWVSLVGNNIGNSPKISNVWSVWTGRSVIYPRINVGANPSSAAIITPSGIIRAGGDNDVNFTFTLQNNYIWSQSTPVTDGKNPLRRFNIDNENGVVCVSEFKYLYEWVNSYGDSCSEYRGPEVTGNLVFNFEKVKVPMTIYAIDEMSHISEYSNWESEDYKLICNGIKAEHNDGVISEESLLIRENGSIMVPLDCNLVFDFNTNSETPFKVGGIMIGDNIFESVDTEDNQRRCSVTIDARFITPKIEGMTLSVLIDRIKHNVTIEPGEECTGDIVFDSLVKEIEDGGTYNNRFYLLGDSSIEDYKFYVYQINSYGLAVLVGGYTLTMGQEELSCRPYYELGLVKPDIDTGEIGPMKITADYLIEIKRNEN